MPITLSLNATGTGVSLPSLLCAHSPSSPSSSVVCVTPAGVGANLSLVLSAGGVPAMPTAGSTKNRTGVSYAPSAVTFVAMPNGASPTAGGATISITGRGFGPATYPGAAVDFVLYGHSPSALASAGASLLQNASSLAALQQLMAQQYSGAAASNSTPAVSLPDGVYSANGCAVQNDGQINCAAGPGTGANLALLVSVGGQVPTAPPATQTALGYQPPQVLAFALQNGDGSVSDSAGTGTVVTASDGSSSVFITGLK